MEIIDQLWIAAYFTLPQGKACIDNCVWRLVGSVDSVNLVVKRKIAFPYSDLLSFGL
jgi:hypothetical protein